MDFSQVTLYVVPSGNSLPTTGSTDSLTAGQFGVFRNDNTAATNANIAAASFIYFSQGRPLALPNTGTKRSNDIYTKNVIEWYKITAHSTAQVQITDISDFSVRCGEDITVTLRIKSNYANVGFYNGLTRSYTLTAPCCQCGDDPCDEVDAEALIDDYVTKINADILVNQFVVAEKVSDGSGGFILRINGKLIAAEEQFADPSANPFWQNRTYFWAYVNLGPVTTQNFEVYDACNAPATVTTVQDSTYLRGSSAEIRQMEFNYNSYNTHPIAKNLYRHDIYNGSFDSLVVDGTYYVTYYLKFANPYRNEWNPTVPQDSTVIIAVPTGQTSTLETMLTTYFGAPTDESGSVSTTTTTTSSTTTTTTTT